MLRILNWVTVQTNKSMNRKTQSDKEHKNKGFYWLVTNKMTSRCVELESCDPEEKESWSERTGGDGLGWWARYREGEGGHLVAEAGEHNQKKKTRTRTEFWQKAISCGGFPAGLKNKINFSLAQWPYLYCVDFQVGNMQLDSEWWEASRLSSKWIYHTVCFCSATFVLFWLSEWIENISAQQSSRKMSRIHFQNLNKKSFGFKILWGSNTL